ncbi:MAG TPA: UvrD-helicase domain-containing protein [Aliidongia sp.]|uniref:UvrD-helicase domain-containing protein n=1 Tax=Aliidongia sp. TaxID=1914230 RepID=UPI002DDDA7B8|nr:UvrD-helicase domain-containing protein [Aliidongia sp.]HEV2678284.1 UvrD-helicase domain-containing protein [Aliidongia sp.]
MPLLNFAGRPALDLTDEQFAAATGPHGHALVQACAGAGKTRTLVARYLHRREQGAEPDRMALVTFTRRATAEMLDRLDTFIEDRRSLERRVRTIDGFAQAILRAAAGSLGVVADFGLLIDERRRGDEERPGESREGFVTRLFGRSALDVDEDGVNLLGAFDGFRARLMGKAEIGRLATSADVGEVWRRAAQAYPKYQAAMDQAALYDHAEIQHRIIERCQADPALATKLFGRFTDLLVDEYQDVTSAQVGFFKLFLTGGGRIWAVGDEDQAIFGFRHAEIERIRRFGRDFPDAATYRLGINLRCGRAITGLARAVIESDPKRGARPIELDERRDGTGAYLNPGRVACHEADDAEAEGSWIATRLAALIDDEAMPPERIAVLYRARPSAETVLDAVKAALRRRRIPVEEGSKPGVAFRTIHESKGLEFDAVFLPGLLLGVLPHYRATDASARAEERRLFYVALTRAESRLYLSWPRSRTKRNGDLEAVRPSPFLIDGLAGLDEALELDWQGPGRLAGWLARQGRNARRDGPITRTVPRSQATAPILPKAGRPQPPKSLTEWLAGWSPAEIALLDEHLGRSLGTLQGLIQRPYGELSRVVVLARADRAALTALRRP